MKVKALLSAFVAPLSYALVSQTCACAAFDPTHSAFDRDLSKFVTADGVHYKQWQKKDSALNAYVRSFSKLTQSEYDALSSDDKLALWLNVYNAYTIKLVLDNYPIPTKSSYYPAGSFRQIPDAWETFKVNVAGKDYTLDDIEHSVLRRTFRNPQTHFAVVCAARGCEPLSVHAYVGKDVLTSLADRQSVFLQNKANVEIDSKNQTVTVSQIFKWFPLDFVKVAGMAKRFPPPSDDEIVLAFLSKNLTAEQLSVVPQGDDFLKYKVVYRPFDWSLNDAP